ncbi:hypothetical protein Tco_0331506 [Tanacetum coccineum]
MDDPNITMEEYIRLEEEKSQRHGRTFNWQTASFGKVKYCEDEDDCFTNFETEFLAIVFDDTLTSDAALSYEPTPTVCYFDDLDYFKDLEKEFPTIVYNDALTSKLDSLTEPAISPHHIDKLVLKNDTSLSKHDKEEQNVVYFNDLFPLNMIYPDNLKSDKENDDDDEIDIIQSSKALMALDSKVNSEKLREMITSQLQGKLWLYDEVLLLLVYFNTANYHGFANTAANGIDLWFLVKRRISRHQHVLIDKETAVEILVLLDLKGRISTAGYEVSTASFILSTAYELVLLLMIVNAAKGRLVLPVHVNAAITKG